MEMSVGGGGVAGGAGEDELQDEDADGDNVLNIEKLIREREYWLEQFP